jgi:hypothetical protein
MNVLKFVEEFPDETSCIKHLKALREREGIACKKCQNEKHYYLKAKNQWSCSSCRFRTTLRSGTMMESSKLPIREWFIAIAFMTYSKKGISAKELQRQLGRKRYEPVWLMMHKIRAAMGKRDDRYKLDDMVEFDEGYFETETKKVVKSNLKRGRGSQRQSNVAVMAESTPLEDLETGKKSKHVRYFKMKVLDSHKSEEIDETVENGIQDSSIVFSDKSTSYVDIADYVEVHITEKSTNETTNNTLKWVHIAISNAKRTLLGIHHKIKGKYLQNYLNEFCYKLNRRYFGEQLFDRLLIAVIQDVRYLNG